MLSLRSLIIVSCGLHKLQCCQITGNNGLISTGYNVRRSLSSNSYFPQVTMLSEPTSNNGLDIPGICICHTLLCSQIPQLLMFSYGLSNNGLIPQFTFLSEAQETTISISQVSMFSDPLTDDALRSSW